MRTALAAFRSSVGRVRNISDENDRSIPAILSDPALRDRYETIRCASTVILSGFLESFLKELADKFVTSICALNRPFPSLPERIRHSHYEFGGAVLSRRAQYARARRSSVIKATPEDIAARLASVTSTPYDLVWEAFADTYANPNSEVIANYLRRFGVGKSWEGVSRIA